MSETSKTEIQWGEPPPSPRAFRGPTPAVRVADALRSRPGEWALISGPDGKCVTHAHDIRTGRVRAWQPAGAFEATSRYRPGTEPKRFDVYARYVGDES